ncbi:DUF6470 family protein [Bacillus piscicola]|uniref:DUF6470 family protein n=1 Tax=Bacillus piscicola TaxID=1632684 RepID=UPI001F08D434|nr:DUF6470 family protein [Bacillus piscicola]
MPKVAIRTTEAALGIQMEKPHVEIRQPPADLEIRQRHTDTLEISTTAATLQIDQSAAFADAGLIPPLERASHFSQQALQTALEYIRTQKQDGDYLRAIEKNGGGGKAIAQLAEKRNKLLHIDTELGFIPEHAFKVKFNVKSGTIHFQAERAEADIRVQKNDPQITADRWQVHYDMKQKPSIDFSVSGKHVNKRF